MDLDDPHERARFVRGDSSVMEQIYRLSFETVRQAAGRVIGDLADRDAVVHQVFAELIASRALRARYQGGDLGAWLRSIVRHRALDFVRRERRLVPLDADQDRAEAQGELADFRQDLERFAGGLAPSRRELLRARFIEGLTQVEVAERLGMPRSTLEDWEKQMKADLRAFFADPARGGIS